MSTKLTHIALDRGSSTRMQHNVACGAKTSGWHPLFVGQFLTSENPCPACAADTLTDEPFMRQNPDMRERLEQIAQQVTA